MRYEWSADVQNALRNRFNLEGFRPCQLEAINATLKGLDTFVLMPTGGGKSLCYQLPALVSSGNTKGTTIVVSPLISLMQDQVMHLQKKNIKAQLINSTLSPEEKNAIMRIFANGELELLYVSPEMINASYQLGAALKQLHSNKMLSRFVVDEAHCVSSWGHDFRPDYKTLSILREQYPGIPIMALTATANNRVQSDIMHNLKLNDPVVVKQSFNRPNLFYEVRPKKNTMIKEMQQIITSQYRNASGIVYCFSKKACEDVAKSLSDLGISAHAYHAGMNAETRTRVQEMWQTGRYQVVCATIAFGMGIDKPDVRFVIHQTLPKNLEGYYQETGRAGRDGLPSRCILFYAYQDIGKIRYLITSQKDSTRELKDTQLEFLRYVLSYCENSTDCRRRQVLQYFNESFDAQDCGRQCDNCAKGTANNSAKVNATAVAKKIVQLSLSLRGQPVTMVTLIDIFMGSRSANMIKFGFHRIPGYGSGFQLKLGKSEIERLFHSLVAQDIL
ncbi:hypothetical protein CANCADRAFT_24928, partial [Tortispora caseinolytica NRRL Y-17796]